MRLSRLGTAIFLLTLLVPALAAAQVVATLDSAEGPVEYRVAGAKVFEAAAVGTAFREGDSVRTGQESRAGIVFASGELLRLAPGTTLTFRGAVGSTRSLSMDGGKAHFFGREPGEFPEIDTPVVTTAVRGTEFVIETSATATKVSVLNGQVECRNRHGSALAGGGELLTTELGKAPVKGILVNPRDAVQWTLYYPTLTDLSGISNRGAGADLREAQKHLSSGQVGRAEEALLRAERESGSAPASDRPLIESLVAGQRAVIAVVRGDKAAAQSEAERAWQRNENADTALARAYVLQSQFKLEEAREWLARAAKLAPDSGLVAARMAEIELGFGDIERATELGERAVALAPGSAYALSVLGFVRLARDDADEAKPLFERAISLDNGFGLARLGLGLTRIRVGDVGAGRAEIERAAALEPNVSLYRSYLGKAFFEEERERLALDEYDQAIAIDERDPTPYLYRAYSKLAGNRPVEALKDVETSVELNNNRAVYRSRLLLDRDLGVRSAGLAEMFTALGFSQAARIEAIKSINRDYTNYSAHRFLSEANDTIRLDDAFISERKIASLLAPLSFNLYDQPSTPASLNDYNALFDKDETRYELGGEFSTANDLLAPATRFAGKDGDFGYLLSYEGDYGGGTKSGSYQRQHISRAAVQYQPVWSDLVLLEGGFTYRDTKLDAGFGNEDLEIDFDSSQQSRLESYDVELGYHHFFGPGSTFLFQSSFSNLHSSLADSSNREILLAEKFNGTVDTSEILALLDEFQRDRIRSSRTTAQWIYDSNLFSAVLGGQYYRANVDREEDSVIELDQDALFDDFDYRFRSAGYNELDSVDSYLYTTWHLAPWIDVIGGVSYTEVEIEESTTLPLLDATYTKSKVSPKAGVTMYPTDSLTIRGAYFEGLRKSSLEDRLSLEPTLVGGINQRFTDFAGDQARSYGAGADYKFSGSTYFGTEVLRRHRVSDNRNVDSVVGIDFDELTISESVSLNAPDELHTVEDIWRSYLYQIISDRVVGTIDYESSRFEDTNRDFYSDTELDRLSLGLRYFDPSGWFLFGEGVYREQDRVGGAEFEDGEESFWTLNSTLGYRLPARHGVIAVRLDNILGEGFDYDQSLGLERRVNNGFNASLVFAVNF